MAITKFFGLLHVNSSEASTANCAESNFEKQISVYLLNAVGLAKSLSIHGLSFELITNDREYLTRLIGEMNIAFPLIVTEIEFELNVPSGTRFYSAHYKLDLFRYIASLDAGYFAFCDLDMVCTQPMPAALKTLSERNIPVGYDISDLVIPAYGHDVIISDLTKISGLTSEGRWFGGEFIAGGPSFFKELADRAETLLEAYFENLKTLHHVGDETISSASFELMRYSGWDVADGGTLSIVARYWNALVLHPQKPFRYYENAFLLHLPSDKKFLARYALREPREYEKFVSRYRSHRRSLSSISLKARQAMHRLNKLLVAKTTVD